MGKQKRAKRKQKGPKIKQKRPKRKQKRAKKKQKRAKRKQKRAKRKQSHMIVKVTQEIHGMERKYSKCFPKDDCKCQNVEKELDDHAKALHASGKAKVKYE